MSGCINALPKLPSKELTIPFEDGIEEIFQRKKLKYAELVPRDVS